MVVGWLPPADPDPDAKERDRPMWDEVTEVIDAYEYGCVEYFWCVLRNRLGGVITRRRSTADEPRPPPHERPDVRNKTEAAQAAGYGGHSQMSKLLSEGERQAGVNLGAAFRLSAAFPGLSLFGAPVIEACQVAGMCAAVVQAQRLLAGRGAGREPAETRLTRVEYLCLANMYTLEGWQPGEESADRPQTATRLTATAAERLKSLASCRDDRGAGDRRDEVVDLARLNREFGRGYLLTWAYIAGGRRDGETG